ncbi:MAG: hypothetical protein IKY10_05335 [Clostridia bacterium]|nr:hypothetical protein [Clostridia bacterium]
MNVDNATYGTVTKTSADIENGSSITINGNALTIGGTTIHAYPAQATAQYSYEFAGWVGVTDGSKLNKDLIVYAMFTRSINQYTIKFEEGNANGSVDVESVNAPYGTLVEIQGNVITIGATTITATGKGLDVASSKEWVFDYWEGAISVVDGNATIKAYFKGVERRVNITIKTNNAEYGLICEDNETTKAQFEFAIGYGNVVELMNGEIYYGNYYSAVPEDASAQYTYTFVGWFVGDVAFETDNITEDTIIEARFERSVNDYTITINSNNEAYGTVTLNKIENVVYGTKIKATDNLLVIGAHTVVANVADLSPRYEYKFIDWTISSNVVNGDVTITANFEQVERVFKVTVVVNDENGGTISGYLDPITVNYGATIIVSDNTITIDGTTITATAKEGYRFVEWQGVVGAVNNDITITAAFIKQVSVTFATWCDAGEGEYPSNTGFTTDAVIEFGDKYGNHDTFSIMVDLGTVVKVEKNRLTVGDIVLDFAVGSGWRCFGAMYHFAPGEHNGWNDSEWLELDDYSVSNSSVVSEYYGSGFTMELYLRKDPIVVTFSSSGSTTFSSNEVETFAGLKLVAIMDGYMVIAIKIGDVRVDFSSPVDVGNIAFNDYNYSQMPLPAVLNEFNEYYLISGTYITCYG